MRATPSTPKGAWYEYLQVLSDGTLVDGTVRNHGYFEYTFSTGGQESRAVEQP